MKTAVQLVNGGRPRLITGSDEIDAIALIGEYAREVENYPAAVFALLFVGRRSGLGVTHVADAVSIQIALVGIPCDRTVVYRIGHSVAVRIGRGHAPGRAAVL